MENRNIWHQEEKATFQVGSAFYNPQSKFVRDLGVLAAAIYRLDHGCLRILDALAGSGVRSLRYYLESNADYMWVNEGNPQPNSIIQQNLHLAIATDHFQITHQDAHRVFFHCYQEGDYYQLSRYKTLAQQWHWQRIVKLLDLMEKEIDFPPREILDKVGQS